MPSPCGLAVQMQSMFYLVQVWVIVPMDLLQILFSLLGKVLFIPVNNLLHGKSQWVNVMFQSKLKLLNSHAHTLTFIKDAAPCSEREQS